VARKKLGEILVDEGLITPAQLEQALGQSTGGRLGETLVTKGWITHERIAQAIARQFHLPYKSLRDLNFDPEAVKLLSSRTARNYQVVPISRKGNRLTVGTSDPLNAVAIDDIALITGLGIDIVVLSTTDIDRALARLYPESTTPAEIPEGSIDANPVVRLVNNLINQAIQERASDIHLEPGDDGVRIRFRIDGLLQTITRVNKDMALPVVSRIKVMSGLDISERRLPQDGSARFTAERETVDLRVSTLPTMLGEKIVMRILRSGMSRLSLADIGLLSHDRESIERMIKNSYGMLLVTGPTGSGKTTTLYSALDLLHQPNRNIVTVEDPVEFRVPGINQVHVNHRIGLTFSTVLRALVRQDPDVIMVGEIRDTETADIAIRSALTGHFVLSSLHTNDSASTVTRLVDMGVEPFLVASSLIGIVAQRLVRRLCTHCRSLEVFPSNSPELLAFGLSGEQEFYIPVGCDKCNGEGYKGRVGIFEVLTMSEEMRELVVRRASTAEVRALAKLQGTNSFREDGLLKAKQGVTTLSEVLRVAFQEG